MEINKEDILERNRNLEDKRRVLKNELDEDMLNAGVERLGMDWFVEDDDPDTMPPEEAPTGIRRVQVGNVAIELRNDLYCILSDCSPDPFCMSEEELLFLEKAIRQIIGSSGG